MKYSVQSLFLALLLLASCKSDHLSVVTTGDMYGDIRVWEGNVVNPDGSGVTVKLEGTNFSTVTNEHGEWKLLNVPARNYKITYSKPGYGTVIDFAVEHLGGEPTRVHPPYAVSLRRPPACSPVIVSVRKDGQEFYVDADIPCNQDLNMYVAYFFSNSPAVSSDFNGHRRSRVYPLQGYEQYPMLKKADFEGGEPFVNYGIDVNDTIYVAAYALSSSDEAMEPRTGRRYYPAMNPAPAATFAIKFD